jgi:hypothetical protein
MKQIQFVITVLFITTIAIFNFISSLPVSVLSQGYASSYPLQHQPKDQVKMVLTGQPLDFFKCRDGTMVKTTGITANATGYYNQEGNWTGKWSIKAMDGREKSGNITQGTAFLRLILEGTETKDNLCPKEELKLPLSIQMIADNCNDPEAFIFLKEVGKNGDSEVKAMYKGSTVCNPY